MSDEYTKKCQDAYNFLASVAGFEPEEYDAFQVDRYHNGIIAIVPGKPKQHYNASAVFRASVRKIFAECIQEYNQAQARALTEYKESQKHPGMERFQTIEEFWCEAQKANLEPKIREAVLVAIEKALR